MIHHKGDFIFVENGRVVHLFHLIDRNRGRNVIAENQIQIRLNQLPGPHLRKARMRRQNFLGHCHSHDFHLLLNMIYIIVL